MTLRTFKLDEKNDLTTLNRSLAVTSSKSDYVAQKVKGLAETFLGEWYRDRGIGVPYFEEFLVAAPDFNTMQNILTAEARSVEYVIDVTGYEYTTEGDTYSANITLLIEGDGDGDSPQTVVVSFGV